jgi:hypothetical protein
MPCRPLLQNHKHCWESKENAEMERWRMAQTKAGGLGSLRHR